MYRLILPSLLALPATASAEVYLHYAFDGDLLDGSGNGRDGSLVVDGGQTTFTDAQAAFGSALSQPFQDAEDRVAFPAPFEPDGAWTVAFWHDMSGGASCPMFDSTSDDNLLRMRADADNAVYLRLAGQSEIRWSTLGVVTQGTFNHLVVVADPAGVAGVDADADGLEDHVALYIDGVLRAPDAGVDLSAYATDLWSDGFGDGASADSTYYNGHGVSDELWIFSGDALDADQVASLRLMNDPCLGDADGDGIWDCVDVEQCDGLDNDGDGLVDADDADLADGLAVYADEDGDGLGDPASAAAACAVEDGWVLNAGDLCPTDDPGTCDDDADGCLDDVDSNGVCDLDQVFALSATDAAPGQTLTLTAAWATPGATVYFLGGGRGEQADAACVTAASGAPLCVDVVRPT
ncbi:MAG TPA: hypothetical protein PKA64_22840, partial [Myxococcota bacterium]|nr:hypothetical protein [Myxococcota bacterium]